MHQKFCKIGLTLGSFDFYLLLIDLHVYSEVFAMEPFILLYHYKGFFASEPFPLSQP